MRTSTRTMITVLAALAAALGVPGDPAAASAPASAVVDRVVAVVNDEIITMSDLQRELARSTDIRDERMMLEEMIDRKLQMEAAKRNGMDVSERELNEAVADIMKRNRLDANQFDTALAKEGLSLEQYRSDLREQMTLSRLFNKYIRSGVAVDEADIRAYYEANPSQFSLAEEIRVRHLVVKAQEKATPAQEAAARAKAEGLLARIRKGEDFVQLIRDHSDGPTVAQDGDLGYLQRGQALPEIEAAAKDLKPGEYAGPVRSSDGYHLLRLEEVRTPRRPYEKVKDEITKLLYEQKVTVTYRTWLQTLRSDSHIENRL